MYQPISFARGVRVTLVSFENRRHDRGLVAVLPLDRFVACLTSESRTRVFTFFFWRNDMKFRECLRCPLCNAPLPSDTNQSKCPNGHAGYLWENGKAVFDVAAPVKANTDVVTNQGIMKRLVRFPSLRLIVEKVISVNVVYKTRESRDRVHILSSRFRDGFALNVGSGNCYYGPQFVNIDIGVFPNVDIVASIDRLPFGENQFDLVVCEAVLEHVRDPEKVVEEMIRVLKPGGELYAGIPFIQGFHPTPGDYQRYTISGIEELFSEIEKVDKGVVNGPASALCWVLREFLAILFSFGSQTLYKIGLVAFGWLIFPIKYFDIILESSKFAIVIGSGFYFRGRKPLA